MAACRCARAYRADAPSKWPFSAVFRAKGPPTSSKIVAASTLKPLALRVSFGFGPKTGDPP